MSETGVEAPVKSADVSSDVTKTDVKTPEKGSPEKPSISPSKKETDMASQAFIHLAAGKRHLAVSDFKNAVTDLEEACRILGEIFGEDGDECADGYYYYGLALLDLARQESGVLAELPESESEEDKTDESDEQKEESEKAKVKSENGGQENGETEGVSNGTVTNGEESAEQKDKAKDIEKPSNEGDTQSNKESVETKEESVEKEESVKEMEVDPDSSKNEADDSIQIDEELESEVRDAVQSALANGDETKKENCLVCRVEVALCKEKSHQEKSGESAEEKTEEQDEKDEKEDEGEKMEEDEEVEENGKVEENGGEEKEENPDEASVEKGTENEQEEEEDEVSNLQLAWEVLELAKVIFTRRRSEGLEIEKKLSMVYMKLGEVSLESENYTQSIEDLKNCLEIRKKVFPAYHRDIAEVHYQLATALQFDKQYDLAIENYHGAMTVLEEKIKYLNEVIQRRDAKEKGEEVTGDDGTAEREKDAFYTEQDEIKEIEGLFPDLKEKITDTKDLKTEHIKKLAQMSARMLSGEGGSGSGSSSSFNPSVLGFDEEESSSSKPSAASVAAASPTKPAVNISHLVKRKRKADEEGEPEEKKPKVLNGNSVKE